MNWKRDRLGGIIHTYQRYDPAKFPSPTSPPPDLVSGAFEHLMTFGDARQLSEEDLANAVHLDASQIKGLGLLRIDLADKAGIRFAEQQGRGAGLRQVVRDLGQVDTRSQLSRKGHLGQTDRQAPPVDRVGIEDEQLHCGLPCPVGASMREKRLPWTSSSKSAVSRPVRRRRFSTCRGVNHQWRNSGTPVPMSRPRAK
jgi:hypothetical protein